MINLLPPAARTHATHEYWRRLAAVSMAIAGALCLAGMGFLAPAYMVVRSEQDNADRAEALAAQTLSDPQLSAAGGEIAQETQLLAAVSKKSSEARPSAVMQLVAAARPPGVAVRQISFSNTGKAITISLAGVAATREGLLNYKTALTAIPGVTDADFPPSNLAASSTVLFTMNVKYAPGTVSKSSTKPVLQGTPQQAVVPTPDFAAPAAAPVTTATSTKPATTTTATSSAHN
jgi:hypothetical protein